MSYYTCKTYVYCYKKHHKACQLIGFCKKHHFMTKNWPMNLLLNLFGFQGAGIGVICKMLIPFTVF